MKKTLNVNWTKIVIFEQNENDYISLTDIAKYKWDKPDLIMQNWIRTNNTIQFLWIWEQLNNPDFNPFIFEGFKNESAENSFIMTPKKWIDKTNAIWIISKPWRYWGTYAHKDIAFKFASWISVEFELYIIKEFQRLKEEEKKRELSDWDVKRSIASVNYKIQTDSIKDNLIPTLSDFKKKYIYADEADLLNLIIFWKTSKIWKEENIELSKTWNMRDFADVIELIILSNLESFNANFINEWLSKIDRYEKLLNISETQKKSLIWDKKLINFRKQIW